ncbi:hypothetical protein PISL3812_01820 [Talaromyces islandicus]|uniref:ABM domain-containing protein n=1 Tax=Talaromyces islandicus TaxID=28573 RepID=A0A0U1LQL3_TALIS|nr:hypothetical protein PISL3812_01820 [Talaromyces islandicus]
MSGPPKSSTVTQFIYFRLKPSVKPEDDGQNREGEQLLDLFRETILQSGHLGSAWGRTLEDENNLVWVIEWADSSSSIPISRLEPFIDSAGTSPDDDDDPTKLITFFTSLSPPISTTETLTKNPVTELASFAIPDDIAPKSLTQFNIDLNNFRDALVHRVQPADVKPASWSMGQVGRPTAFDHPDSTTGKVFAYLLAVGWQSKEKHMAVRETKEFKETIVPLRQAALSPLRGLEMRHVTFQRIGF